MSLLLCSCLVAFSSIVSMVNGHVALTFPPARKYDLDFLDTFRTKKPCGMDKGTVKTTLLNNGDVEITWHLGYPHQGGFKLQLLDSKEQLLKDLTPPDLFEGSDNNEQQQYRVSLDKDLVCLDCTIRLERQALEWGANYRFQSCANVDIVSLPEFKNDCSGHGTLRNGGGGPPSGTCDCQRTYFGDRCQFKNDCEDASDCADHGRCIDIKGTALPKKQCYCEFGYFGFNCEKISSIRSNNFTASAFQRISSPGVDFFWRILPGSIVEGVIVGKNTESYVAVGFRPKGLTRSCQNFPEDAAQPIGSDFHAMDCTDIIIGTVKDGTLSRVEDYYTRDRSTPRPDSFYGGSSSLTGALGWEQDGQTTIMFRRPIRGQGKSDHDFNGQLHLIWAHGRSDLAFFEKDELKFHGTTNRGILAIDVSSAPRMNLSVTSLIVMTMASLLCLF